MDITIHYRGALKDLDRVEDFEDRVFDLALELGGQARIWRTAGDSDPSRVVRGIVLDLCPGQETTCLLLSPEGWLIGLTDVEDAESGKLREPPWCMVRTQFGTLGGHVALVELLRSLKVEFFPDLEVSDEGGYWEHRDVRELAEKRGFVQTAIKQFGDGLEQFGLSTEAAEDPNTVGERIERVVRIVQGTLKRPSEHPLVHWDDDDLTFESGGPLTPEEEVRWDASFKENRRRQERVGRAIEKHLAEGKSIEEAMDASMREETVLGLPEDEAASDADREEWSDEDQEDWRDSLPDEDADDDDAEDWLQDDDDSCDDIPFDRHEFHPLLRRSHDLLLRLHDLLKDERGSRGCIDTLMQGAMEISGGLAQALSFDDDDGLSRGLDVVQLKRSLRGAAFAIGALFLLRQDGLINEAVFDELRAAFEEMQYGIDGELRHRRAG